MAIPATIGRYEVLERLGEGGMGAVYLGRDPNIGRQIAIKVLHGHLADASLRLRFAQEARAAGSLAHPHIVTVHDFGEVEGTPFLVMEHVRGDSLAAIIRERREVPLATKIWWLEGLCAGLQYAHDMRIVHRDIKPQNLMVDERGTLKILDFGIARMTGSGLTRMSVVVGTPGYMSPEQIEGKAVDRRSDVFSTGAVAYALLAYREAFTGDTVATVMHRVLHEQPAPLETVCVGLPPAVAAIVDRALRKAPLERFQDIGEMRLALERARLALVPGAHEPVTAPMTPPGRLSERRTPFGRTPAEIARRRAEEIQRHIAEAMSALDRGDVVSVEAACEAVLYLDPEHAEAQRLLAAVATPSGAIAAAPPAASGPQAPVRPTPPVPTEPPPLASALTLPRVVADTTPPAIDPAATPQPFLSAPATPPPVPLLSRPTPPPPPATRPPAPPPPQSAVGEVVPVARAHRGWLAPAVVVGVLGLILIGGAFALRNSGTPPASTVSDGHEPPPPEPATPPQPSDVDRLLGEARAAEGAARWGDARAGYRAVLAIDATHADATAALARLDARERPAAPTVPDPPRERTDPVRTSTTRPAGSPYVMVNADVIALSKRGMSDTEVIALVARSKHDLDLTPSGVAALRSAGVSDRVITGVGGRLPAPPAAPPVTRPAVGTVRVRGLAGAEVSLGTQRATIAPTGEVVLADVAPGTHQVRVVMPNLPPHVSQVAVTADAEAVVFVPTPAPTPTPRTPTTTLPARPPTSARKFDIPSALGSRSLSIAADGVQFERRDSRGRLSDESFTLKCDEVQLERGTYGMSLRMRRRGGRSSSIEARGQLLTDILAAYDAACGRR